MAPEIFSIHRHHQHSEHAGRLVADNPYESPSAAVFEEATSAPVVLDAAQLATVQWFLHKNQLASKWLVGAGCVIGILVPLFLAFVRNHLDLPVGVGCTAIGIVLIVLGIFQGRRNLAAISITGVGMVCALVAVLTSLSLHLLGKRSLDTEDLSRILLILLMLCFGVWGLVFVPAWLAVRAWLWSMQGIELAKLDEAEYRRVTDGVVPPKFPLGDT
jgi:hypothetical protein